MPMKDPTDACPRCDLPLRPWTCGRCTARNALEQAALYALEYFENREDVDDGDYGQPKPNREMQLATALRAAMGLTREGM